jgi:hypothetical protein
VAIDEDVELIKKKNKLLADQKDDVLGKSEMLNDLNRDSSFANFGGSSNIDPIAYGDRHQKAPSDSNARIIGLSEGPQQSLNNWKKRFLQSGYDSVSGKGGTGGERTMLNTTDGFAHESHSRMERLKLKFDENQISAFNGRIFLNSDILTKVMNKRLVYYS